MYRGAALRSILFLMFFAACATSGSAPRTSDNAPSLLLAVPFFDQEDRLCGPASLAAVLHYWQNKTGTAKTPLSEIAQATFLPAFGGALGADLARFARGAGFTADSYPGDLADLRTHLLDGRPPIVFLNLGYRRFPTGHFVVVTGLDADGVLAHSGSQPNAHFAYDDFMAAWAKTNYWTLTLHPKDSS